MVSLSMLFYLYLWITSLYSFYSITRQSSRQSRISTKTFQMYLTSTLSSNYGDSISAFSNSFDTDFASAISKPLPQWYVDASNQIEKVNKEVEEQRDRSKQEFRMKYEVEEETKRKEKLKKWEEIQARIKNKKLNNNNNNMKKNNGMNWLASIFKKPTGTKREELDSQNELTKANWESFWETEEKLIKQSTLLDNNNIEVNENDNSKFYLPSLLEVFPELRELKWPNWSKKKDGSLVDCQSDDDCPLPQTCCNHPIIPGQNFCCTGWGQRMLVPSYVYATLYTNNNDRNNGNNGENGDSTGLF
jgi:hypothetical protein